MKKTEQQLADELDAFLTARLNNKDYPIPGDLSPTEAKFITEMVDLATKTTPDPGFRTELEAKLALFARRATSRGALSKKSKQPERMTFWQEFDSFIRSLTMKRTILALSTVAAIFIFAFFAWTFFNKDGQGDEQLPVADITAPEVEDTTTEETGDASVQDEDSSETSGTPEIPTELALLPRMESNQTSQARGMGGGGGGLESGPAEQALAPIDSAMMIAPDFSQVFLDANYVLNTTLPVESTTGIVLQRVYIPIEEADARRIADQFGFSGPLYTEVFDFGPQVFPAVEPVTEPGTVEEGVSTDRPPKEGEEPTVYIPPTVYHLFDGPRQLIINENSWTYINRDILVKYSEEVPNAVQIAENFLLDRGLLSFPYVLEAGFGHGEVSVKRLIEGQPLGDDEIYVQVDSRGEVAFASHHQFGAEPQMLGTYPLISAEQAWQLIQEGVVENNISFSIMPDFVMEGRGGFGEPPEGVPQYWQRQYAPGMEAHLYNFPMVYQRVDGDGPPLLDTGELIINGNLEDLQTIADQISEVRRSGFNQNLHMWGQISLDEKTLELVGWEFIDQFEPLFFEGGNIQQTADGVLFSSSAGETYIIPDAPADLPDGMKVNLFAWSSRDVGLAYPILDWQNIDEWFDYNSEAVTLPAPEPGIVEEAYVDPFTFTVITIDKVEIGYQYIFDFESFDKSSRPPAYLQPVWIFSGQTDLGDTIELRVQAVSPEYLQTP